MVEVIKQENALEKAVEVLQDGGIIVYPTETSYGIGADALNSEAVAKVHSTKKQPEDKPISVIVASEKQAEEIVELNEQGRRIIREFMPGPLTLICEQKDTVPENLTTNGVAFRIPGNEFAHKLVEKFGRAITATSANIHGKPAIFSASEAAETFRDSVDLIVDAGTLPTAKASTIYCNFNNILFREGSIKQEELEKVLGHEVQRR